MLRFRLSLIFFMLSGGQCLIAGDGIFARKYVEPSFYNGSVLPQNDNIRYLVEDHLKALQLIIGINTDGSREWHQYLNFPRLGIGIQHSSLGNNDVFGKANSFFGTAAIKTFKQKYVVNLEHNLTAGVGILTKHYSLKNNPLNMAFGKPVVFYLQYALLVPVRLSRSLEFYAGPCFSHFSAAKIVQPNLGLHILQLRAGARYNITPAEYEDHFENHPMAGHQIMLVAAGGIKQYSRFDTDKYAIFSLSPEYTFKITPVFGIGAVLGLYLDTSVKPAYLENYKEKAHLGQYFHSTIHANFHLYIGNLTFLVQPGTYLSGNPGFYESPVLYKLGFRYRITDHMSASAVLKAHWLAKADFLELGIGYSFLKNEKR